MQKLMVFCVSFTNRNNIVTSYFFTKNVVKNKYDYIAKKYSEDEII